MKRILLLSGVFLLLGPVWARSADGHPDPILAGPAPGPCAERAAGADYAAGLDATGNPVVPAEGSDAVSGMGQGRVMVDVPRPHGRDVSVPVNLADLSPPACTEPPRRHSPH